MRGITLEVQDYLEAASESSKRTRTVTIVLVVSTVLTFVGLLNSNPKAWMLDRIQKVAAANEKYLITKLGPAPTQRDVEANYEPVKIDNEWKLIETSRLKDITDLKAQGRLQDSDDPYAKQIAEFFESKETMADDDKKKNLFTNKHKGLDENYQKAREQLSAALIRDYAENSLLLRAPFFGITFDVNDLYLLSGTAFIVILLLLRFSLGRELANLKLSFREAIAQDQLVPFYRILAMRQVFTFPQLPEYTKPMILWAAPHLINFLPVLVYFFVWYQDNVTTRHIGRTLSSDLWWWQSHLSPVLLGGIFILSVLCSIRVWRIDNVWAEYWYLLTSEVTITRKSIEAVNNSCKELVEKGRLGQASDLIVNTGYRNITDKQFSDMNWSCVLRLAEYEEHYNDGRAMLFYKIVIDTNKDHTEETEKASARLSLVERRCCQFWRRKPKRRWKEKDS